MAAAQLIPNDHRLDVARYNREILEDRLARGAVTLGRGIYHLDRQLELGPRHSGCVLAGAGAALTILRNSHETYPRNRTLWIAGLNYQPHPTWQRDEAGLLRYAQAIRLAAGALPGGTKLLLDGSSHLYNLAGRAGRWIYVTSGIATLNELRGEWRRIVSYSEADGLLLLDRPLRHDYAGPDAAVLLGVAAQDITIRDLTLAQPVHGEAVCFGAKWAVGLTLKRVRFGVPAQPASRAGCASCGYVAIVDCDAEAAWEGNTTHDLSARGGQWRSLVGEEMCLDWSLNDLVVAVGGRRISGVHWYQESDGLRLTNVRVEGGGAPVDDADLGRGTHVVLSAVGRGVSVRDVAVSGTHFVPGYSGIALGGDGLRVDNLRADVPLFVDEGRDIGLSHVRCPTVLLRKGTTGSAWDCGPDLRLPVGGWAVGGAVTDPTGSTS